MTEGIHEAGHDFASALKEPVTVVTSVSSSTSSSQVDCATDHATFPQDAVPDHKDASATGVAQSKAYDARDAGTVVDVKELQTRIEQLETALADLHRELRLVVHFQSLIRN